MPLNAAGLNAQAAGLASVATHLGLATADPGTTGTSPSAAARIAAGWSAPANGDITASNKNFTGGAASGPIHSVTFWSAATGGTYYGNAVLTGDTSFNAAGEYTLTSVTVDGQ